ncbi:shikimate dehydrogenase [Prochlorococcus sp. MIT 1223]|uniref:shikimate dehydrogenase n=1 Tax=Prochlorococcus sp. MIT 1223 TaxID=3096217 RepID=UPI002A7543EA|nr:shikimate dehydrogenase [Prochlorococcus sp. MIT 1223]
MSTISGQTKLVAVLGNPVRHSISPVIHNAAFSEMNLDWSYLAIPCKPEDLKEVTNALLKMECVGLNITIPHKREAIMLCEKVTSTAQQIGAVNTLVANRKGAWNGSNTDIDGFIAPLKDRDWKKKKVIILGCGGSARAVLIGAKLLDFEQFVIVSRNKYKVKEFIKEMEPKLMLNRNQSIEIIGLSEEDEEIEQHIKNADLIVNTTPVGMFQNTKSSQKMPLGPKIWNNLKESTTLYDLIYTPKPTDWLRNGAKKNCKTIDGLEMLIEQGAASLKLWSGIEKIPTEVMRQAALKYLNK